MKQTITKDVKKAFKKLPKRFFVEALSGEAIRWDSYRNGKYSIGKAVLAYANTKFGGIVKIQPDSENISSIMNIMIELKLVEPKGSTYFPAQDWKSQVDSMFPEEEEKTVAVEEQQQQPTALVVNTMYDFYNHLLSTGVGEEIISRKSTLESISAIASEVTGEDPDQTWVASRIAFLVRNEIFESIKEKGTIYYMISSDWRKKLDSKKNILSGAVRKKASVVEAPSTVVPVPTVTVVPKQEQKEEYETTLIRVSVRDLESFKVDSIIFRSQEQAIIRIPVIPENLRVFEEVEILGISETDKDDLFGLFNRRIEAYESRLMMLKKNFS